MYIYIYTHKYSHLDMISYNLFLNQLMILSTVFHEALNSCRVEHHLRT